MTTRDHLKAVSLRAAIVGIHKAYSGTFNPAESRAFTTRIQFGRYLEVEFQRYLTQPADEDEEYTLARKLYDFIADELRRGRADVLPDWLTARRWVDARVVALPSVTARDLVQEAATHAAVTEALPSYPTELPFPMTFLCYAGCQPLFLPPQAENDIFWSVAVGYLITHDTCIRIRIVSRSEGVGLNLDCIGAVGSWDAMYHEDAWIVHALVDTIQRTGKTTLERLTSHPSTTRNTSPRELPPRALPTAFYRVVVRNYVVEEAPQASSPTQTHESRSLSYQHERRSHIRLKVARGTLPMDEETRRRYALRARTLGPHSQLHVFCDDISLPSDLSELLDFRGIPAKRSDEWMVLTVTHVKAAKVPAQAPSGMPFIPAVRVLQTRNT